MADQNRDSDECMDIYCDLCKEHAANVPAQGFCPDCVEYLCSTCLTYHQRYMRTHKHQDENQMPKDVCTDTCDKHVNIPVKFYCENCNDFICMQCRSDKHNNCTKCSFLPLLAQNIENSEDFRKFENRLEHFKRALDETEVSHYKKQENIEHYKKEASTAMESQKKELLEDYSNATKKFERTIEQTYNDNKAKHDSVTKGLTSLADELKTLMNDISNLKNCEQRCKLFMKMKTTVSKIDHLERKLASAKDNSALTVTVYKYNPEVSILKSLSVGEMDINGDIVTSDDCERVSLQQKWMDIEQKTKAVKQMLEENKKCLEHKSREAEQKLAENEKRSKDIEQHYKYLQQKEKDVENKLIEIELKSLQAEQKSINAESMSKTAEQIFKKAEEKFKEAEQRLKEAKEKLKYAEQKLTKSEQKSTGAEQNLTDAERNLTPTERNFKPREELLTNKAAFERWKKWFKE